MKTSAQVILFVIAVIIIGGAVWAYKEKASSDKAGQTTGSGQVSGTKDPIATAQYACNSGKSITTSFYEGTATPASGPNMPPTPGGTAHIVLSDGRTFDLSQTISADGARYASTDGAFVFWTKGNGALVLEHTNQQTYVGCVRVTDNPGNLPQVYSNGTEGFSIRLPQGYTTNATYSYQNLGPGKDIHGVKFVIPAALASGTNLSSDSYISVEEIPQAKNCSAALFVQDGKAVSVTDHDVTYSVATTSDAAAGNRYEEAVYAIPGTNPCIAVRYFIHYGVFENYPTGSIKQFDRQAILDQFDTIRRTLVTM